MYGPPSEITAPGGLTYRFDYTYPTWTESEKSLTELGEVFMDFDGMGRKRNPKKREFRRILRTWNVTDAYCATLGLLHGDVNHPGLTMDVSKNVIYDAIGNVFGDGTRESGKSFGEEYSNTTEGLRESDVQMTTDRASLGEVFGRWLYALADAAGETEQRELLEAMFTKTASPWMLVELLFKNMALYWGTSAAVDVIGDECSLSDVWRRRYRAGTTPNFFMQAWYGETSTTLQPHDPHGTMKCHSISSQSVLEMDQDKWLGQFKYDGARLFIHHAGDGDVRAYTSGLKDVTAALPELEDIEWPNCAFIFDAEAVPYDVDGNVQPFEEIMTRVTRVDDIDLTSESTKVHFKLFDCPVWYGDDITQRGYESRFSVIQALFPPNLIARTGSDLEKTFSRSLDEGHEGLVIKRRDSTYIAGGRHDRWRKWKQEPETADVVVLGVKRGVGKFDDRMGALEIGLLQDGIAYSVGYVGTGFTDEERADWWRRFELGKAVDSVIEVKFEDLQFASGSCSLRFPRFKRERPDGEIDTVERIARLMDRESEFSTWH